jgi:hypothetical protein
MPVQRRTEKASRLHILAWKPRNFSPLTLSGRLNIETRNSSASLANQRSGHYFDFRVKLEGHKRNFYADAHFSSFGFHTKRGPFGVIRVQLACPTQPPFPFSSSFPIFSLCTLIPLLVTLSPRRELIRFEYFSPASPRSVLQISQDLRNDQVTSIKDRPFIAQSDHSLFLSTASRFSCSLRTNTFEVEVKC